MVPLQVTFPKISRPFLNPCVPFNPRNQRQEVRKLTRVEDKKRMVVTGQKISSIKKRSISRCWRDL
jgi:hypothetical protein